MSEGLLRQHKADTLPLLRLLHLADSALPVGAAAHSFGLESLIEDGLLAAGGLESFCADYLEENGALEAAYCLSAYRLAQQAEPLAAAWLDLNRRLSARRPARESREASLALGRRFLRLALDLGLPAAVEGDSHHCAAFGLTAALAGVDERSAVAAWLHQSLAAVLSAAQRLAPLGQTRAAAILWSLKPRISAIADSAGGAEPPCFMPGPEVASMRHSRLATRLFIS
ncbi:MAG TPA: urease accessory UreF family protein [Bryobacteraceae bacterium]|jgi:urease accessory protein|nr:urease accessory UreF family protein [Bryobacteraceae bacterium]